jgi:2-haloalkanoic acid dehalogenase type II
MHHKPISGQKEMRYKAFLFDFYGTVVEEADNYRVEICNKISQCCEPRTPSQVIANEWYQIHPKMCHEAYGTTFRLQKDLAVESLQFVLNKYKCELNASELMGTIHNYWGDPNMFPESKSVLRQCNVPTCLVTNIDNEFIDTAMKKHDLHFDYVITSESCRSYKPRVDIFLKALSCLELRCKEVLHVGDSYPIDVLGAHAAGIPVLWINRKNKMLPYAAINDIVPNYTSKDLSGILDLL